MEGRHLRAEVEERDDEKDIVGELVLERDNLVRDAIGEVEESLVRREKQKWRE